MRISTTARKRARRAAPGEKVGSKRERLRGVRKKDGIETAATSQANPAETAAGRLIKSEVLRQRVKNAPFGGVEEDFIVWGMMGKIG